MATKTEALKQIYASAPIDTILFSTIEVNHPDFIDEEGNHAAVRAVQSYTPLTATLEDNAPMNPGATVEFTAIQFDIQLAGYGQDEVPNLVLTLDNVGQEMMRYLEQAMSSPKLATVIYREYTQADLSGPQMVPPISLVVVDVKVDVFQCTITADATSMQNSVFPNRVYKITDFPGLNR